MMTAPVGGAKHHQLLPSCSLIACAVALALPVTADAAGTRAVLEITPQAVTVRRGEPGKALFSTNHQRSQDCNTPGLCYRYDALHDAARDRFGPEGGGVVALTSNFRSTAPVIDWVNDVFRRLMSEPPS